MMPPCDLASVAAVLRKAGAEPRILDLRLRKNPVDVLLSEVKVWKPEAVITNMATVTAMDDYPLINLLRERVEKRLLFGFHAMALPDEAFRNGATHILAGDPEYAAASVVNSDASETLDGVWTPDNITSPPGWTENLDDLPFPALDLIEVRAYHSLIMGRQPFSILLANRGCTYKCPYCVIPFLLGPKVRTFSVDRIVDEIERDLRQFSIRSFFFIDSAINLKPRWTTALCEELLRRDLKIRWCSNMRVPPVDRDLLALMKRSGCFRLFYGVEDLDLVQELDRKTTWEATRQAFALTREAGIETVAFVVLFPDVDRTEKDMVRRIMRQVNDIKPDALQCNIAVPYPGSRLYEDYCNQYDMSDDWSLYDPSGRGVPYSSKIDLIKVRRGVYASFFLSHPRYLLRTFLKADVSSILTFARGASKVFWPARQTQ